MLVLTRKIQEEIYLTMNGVLVKIKVNEIAPGKVRLGFTAPDEVVIFRKEAYENLTGRTEPDGDKK